MHIDISPWGEEIAMNLQLLQDRVRTESLVFISFPFSFFQLIVIYSPQGAYHNVVLLLLPVNKAALAVALAKHKC